MDGDTLHILMLPWLALGHLIPFLELSKSLARKNHRISFLTTPKNLTRLPPMPSNLTHLINFIQLPLPPIQNLPQNAEATIDLPSHQLRPYLRKAFDTFSQNLSDLIRTKQIPSPDLIIFDYAAYWIPPIAANFRIPCAFFGTFSAAVLSFYGSPSTLMGGSGARSRAEDFTVKPSWIPFSSTIAYRMFEARELVKPGIVPDASGVSEAYRFGKSIEGCQMVLIRSCDELESEWLRLLEELYGKVVVPVGLLPPLIEEERHAALDWLDEKEEGSVVYVAFGSEVKLSDLEVKEISVGLELSGLPFVWALRAGSVPDGLVERVNEGGRGRVWVDWVPQARILAHTSVGGFLTHGGWNSIVEGLGFGRVMVVLPMMFDQGLNARNVVEKGFGLEVPRLEDGFFTGRGIAESLRMAMVEEEGEILREKAKECEKLFGNEELHEFYVRELIERCREIVRLG